MGAGCLDDGVVDLTVLPDLPLSRTILNARHLYDGGLSSVKEVSTARVSELRAICEDGNRVLLDLDGEQPGCLPLVAAVVPKAVFIT